MPSVLGLANPLLIAARKASIPPKRDGVRPAFLEGAGCLGAPLPTEFLLSAQGFIDGLVKNGARITDQVGQGARSFGHKGMRFLFGFQAAFRRGFCASP